MRSDKGAVRWRRCVRTRRKFMRCDNPFPQTNTPLTVGPTPNSPANNATIAACREGGKHGAVREGAPRVSQIGEVLRIAD